MMNPTPTAAEALEAAERWHKHTIEEDLGCDGQDMTDFILANKDALLSLPTPGASTSAERAGWGKVRAELCNGDWRVIDKRGWVITQGVSKHIAEIIADALNAPAAAPVAGSDLALHYRNLHKAVEELLEVAWLRGGNELPHPSDDPKLWTARMQTAWDVLDQMMGEHLPRPLPVPAPTAGGEGGR